MLILRDKIILVDGKPVKLYSFDSKLWFSKPRDIAELSSAEHMPKPTFSIPSLHMT
jgi:hypothetical protein